MVKVDVMAKRKNGEKEMAKKKIEREESEECRRTEKEEIEEEEEKKCITGTHHTDTCLFITPI